MQRVLKLSTRHIHEDDAEKLLSGKLLITVPCLMGFMVSVPASADDLAGKLSPDMLLVLKTAREQDFNWVYFGPGGSLLNTLPVF